MTMNEFDLIDRFFKNQPITRNDVALGIGDDGALICVPPFCQLVVTTDTLVAGNHFLPNACPAKIAHKALAANLSDLAAMGATPAWCSLALTLPKADPQWLSEFCRGFYALAKQYQVQLIGGDTTKGPLSITITLQGYVAQGKAITRRGAAVGDLIYVTGLLGDSGAGLELILKQNKSYNQLEQKLIDRHYYATPRIEAGKILSELASACLDISDGLLVDLEHILKANQVGAMINADALPLSCSLLHYAKSAENGAKIALSSGEEYELCFTVPKRHRQALNDAFSTLNTPITCIGQIQSKQGIDLMWQANAVSWPVLGWDHFLS